MNSEKHVCEVDATERLATAAEPYHYVNSGLPNVWLSGIKYRVCEACKTQEADIPATSQLLEAIARAIVEKHSKLTGPEIRFLRKRLHKKQIEFAPLLDLTAERLSTVENMAEPKIAPVREKFLRTVYRILASDAKLKAAIEDPQGFERWMASIEDSGPGECIVAHWNKRQWKVLTEAA